MTDDAWKEAIDWLKNIQAPLLASPSFVYCLHAEAISRIKIGFSTKPIKRIAGHRNTSPCPLVLIGLWPGGRKEETAIHDEFAYLGDHGEWFEYAPELQAFIKSQSDPVHAALQPLWSEITELEFYTKEGLREVRRSPRFGDMIDDLLANPPKPQKPKKKPIDLDHEQAVAEMKARWQRKQPQKA